ncbi:RpiB/LacA/LacB family sugar-phosphate isomerase [Candidatus Saccharibacteria bacterium TM7i]|nr:RpiB/LacA/LacB family sugar-phosphate isomerase [Candidatus Saccharibacteria bacterium TM7i]
MKLYIGADHQGYHLKDELFAYLSKRGYDVDSVGEDQLDPTDDFPIFAQAVALKVLGSDDRDPRGILLCGSGQGMAMAANRFRGIRAGVVWDAHEAKMVRNDLDSNVLCLPARLLTDADDAAWEGILETWLNTPFSGAVRFRRRNAELDGLA